MPKLHPQAKLVLDLVVKAGNPEYWELEPAVARAHHEERAPVLDAKSIAIWRTEDREADGPNGPIPVRAYWPREREDPWPVLVWLHGGGHVVGSIECYDAVCRLLATKADCAVVSVDYRLAPEHKFPAAVEDSFAALEWVAGRAGSLNLDPTRIAIGGDSAGGNLAAVCTILARNAGGPKLVFQLLVYPVTASSPDSASQREFADGHLLTRKAIDWFQGHYLRADTDRSDFRFAPLVAEDLSNLPPALAIMAECDPLRDEGIEYAEKLRAAGNEVETTTYPGMIHAFFNLSDAVDAGKQAIDQAAAALRGKFLD